IAIGCADQPQRAKQHVVSIAVKAADRHMRSGLQGGRMASTGAEQHGKHNQTETRDSGHGQGDPEPGCALLCRLAHSSASFSFAWQVVENYRDALTSWD